MTIAGSAVLAAGFIPRAASAAVAEDMVLVPAGPFLAGTSPEDAAALAARYGYHPTWFASERVGRSAHLPAFAIDRFPVTNAQYLRFCRSTGQPAPAHWGGNMPSAALLEHPVTHVSKADAEAYAAWAGKRLPTELEWEKAARGTDGRAFPWGDAFDPAACQWNRANTGHGPGTAPVNAHPRGASPYGVMDMVGNVAEWCAGNAGPGAAYVKGGGHIICQVVNLRPAARNMCGIDTARSPWCGFRCAKSALPNVYSCEETESRRA